MAPPVPRTLDEIGLPLVAMRDLTLRTFFRRSLALVSELAQAMCLPVPLAQDLVDAARAQGLLEAMGSHGAGGPGTSEMRYALTESGKARALDALAQSEYFGPMPVPLAQYRDQVARQSIRTMRLSRARLEEAMGDLILPETLISDLGPAIGAGRSILMYGPPGNGKSAISNAIRKALGDTIHVPHAVAYSGQVITLFDPLVHARLPEDAAPASALRRTDRSDRRYVACLRPAVVTGGELSLSMLDLLHNPVARTYQAPLQMKSTGGVFIVDDLGRQAEPPQKLVNRWIVPLEEGRDILALQSGEKFEVPFDTLLIFSTNFHPNEIFDKAALRRIFFKIRVDGPGQQTFLKIFAAVARKSGMQLDEASLVHLLRDRYGASGQPFANYQPGFLIDQMMAICDFEGLPYRMTPDLVDRAWSNMFVRDETVVR